MSAKERTIRLNSLLKEVITEVIRSDVHHTQHVDEFISITRVEITKDLAYAKVFFTVIGSEKKKKQALGALRAISRRIAVLASKKVVMRYFPELDFILDDGLEKQLRVEELLHQISDERAHRKPTSATAEEITSDE